MVTVPSTTEENALPLNKLLAILSSYLSPDFPIRFIYQITPKEILFLTINAYKI